MVMCGWLGKGPVNSTVTLWLVRISSNPRFMNRLPVLLAGACGFAGCSMVVRACWGGKGVFADYLGADISQVSNVLLCGDMAVTRLGDCLTPPAYVRRSMALLLLLQIDRESCMERVFQYV